jgi:hypothetical protein
MSNFKNKYIKYKNKYIELKKSFQNGGMNEKQFELINKIINQETGKINILGITPIYIQEYYGYIEIDRICNAIQFIKKQRDSGKKIMLIVGSVPEQQSKFYIPINYIPIYSQASLIFDGYMSDIKFNCWENLIKKTFEEYPVLFTDIFDIKELQSLFDLIIFDGGTVYWINLNKLKLLNIFKYTYDNSSIVVIDNQTNDNPPYKDKNFKNLYDDYIPMYYYFTSHKNIIREITFWFYKNFNGQYIVNDIPTNEQVNNNNQFITKHLSTISFNNPYITEHLSTKDLSTKELLIMELKQKVFYSDKKLYIYYFNNNIYYQESNNNMYIYFKNTKYIK